jgi:hypothetical protein
LPIDDAVAYHFALYFRLPDHHVIGGGEIELSFADGAGHDRMQLRPDGSGHLGEAKRLTLSGFGYETEEHARAAGHQAKQAMSLAALESHVGVEWDSRGEGGLDVWKGHRALCIVRAECRGSVLTGVGAEALRERFNSWLAPAPRLTVQQRACADLLADFHFDLSGRSRFLLAHAAIEELCKQPIVQERTYGDALRGLVAYLDGLNVDKSTKERLRSDLLELEQVRPTGRCKKIIGDKLGPAAKKRFSELTKIRGKIAHQGHPDDRHLSFELYRLARDLLFATML